MDADCTSIQRRFGIAQWDTIYDCLRRSLFVEIFQVILYGQILLGHFPLIAYHGRIEPFDPLVHLVRPHNGQIKTAARILNFLEDSELMKQPKEHVQDPYSFRCMPQVHGATKDTLTFVKNTFITEINAVTDNPNIFTADDKIISGGNFHGQPLAYGFDFLKIAMAELRKYF